MQLLINSFWPWALILIVAAIHVLHTVARHDRSQRLGCAAALRSVCLETALFMLPLTLVVTFCVVIASSSRIFKTWATLRYIRGMLREAIYDRPPEGLRDAVHGAGCCLTASSTTTAPASPSGT